MWPDDSEERALQIVRRESNFVPSAYNGSCCYGLFQIHFGANQRSLAALGVTSADQLLDPVTNINVALWMYQRSGWGPWGG
jgi:soluble lytic murein transglycosylase-like protein